MKYIQQICGGIISSSILIFSFSIIINLAYPVKYIGYIDATILMQVALLLIFIGLIIEFGEDFFER